MEHMIYLDNAASTRVDPRVARAMREYMLNSYGNPSSIHTFGRNAKEAIEQARAVIADKINADPQEIVFTSGGTESNNLAVGMTASKYISTAVEHQSMLNALAQKAHTILPVDNLGFVNQAQLKKEIKKNAFLSVIHGNNEIGTVNDLETIGNIARKNGAFFHSDACQSFLKKDIDVQKMNIDLLTLNSHKIHGPKGVGALFIRKGIKPTPQFRGGLQEHGRRAGTENVPGIIGFAKAAKLWKSDDNENMRNLRSTLAISLLKIKDSKFNGSKEQRLCNNISISFKNIESESLIRHLDSQGIMASTGSACTSNRIEPSHVLNAIGLPSEWANGTIRLTLSRYTTKKEIKESAGHITDVVGVLRSL